MCKLELQVVKAGGVLIRNSKHKIYDLNGVRIVVPHGGREGSGWKSRQSIRRKLKSMGY